ncbi:hypothetical protein HZA73_03150 [candidate division TA06 bacterium]|nr:hypothetical protein [candidate division TA06 bacterium]
MIPLWSSSLTGWETTGRTKAVIPGGFDGNSYQLPHRHIIKDSDSVLLNGNPLVHNRDYALDCRTGKIYFPVGLKISDTVTVFYRTLPFSLPEKIIYMPLLSSAANIPDTVGAVAGFDQSAVQTYKSWLNEKSGQVSFGGSKSLGISAGTGRDFSLEQALQVSIDGQLNPSLKVNAFLSDQNMPLSASGSTEDLSQIEKVYIKAQGNAWEAVLGDYELDHKGTSYFQMKRQLQGVKAAIDSKQNNLALAAAVTKGKKNRSDFTGQDGKQGPYQLTAVSGESVLKILANTERIWLNGQLLKRGEHQDYQLDYETGLLTFNPQWLISSESRIMAEFEYSGQNYQRPFYSAAAKAGLGRHLSIKGGYRQEGDDYSRPLAEELSQQDKNVLVLAGDDTSRYWADGGTLVEAGQGNYLFRDSFYVYAGTDSGNYLVSFTKVDSGRGDYRDSIGIIVYTGRNLGDYLAIKKLAAPSQTKLYTMGAYLTWPGGHADFEGAGSDLDKNLLSGRDDGNNRGYSGMTNIFWKRDTLWGGGFEVNGRTLAVNPNFEKSVVPFDPDFINRWQLYNWNGTKALSLGMLRGTTEYGIKLGPEMLKAEAGWGRLEMEQSVWARSYKAGLQFRPVPGYLLKYGFNRNLLGQAWPETASLGKRDVHQAWAGVSYMRWNYQADLSSGADQVERGTADSYGKKYYLAGLGMGRKGDITEGRLTLSRREDLLKDSLGQTFKSRSYTTDLITKLGLLTGRAFSGGLEHQYRRLVYRPGVPGQNLNTHLAVLRTNYQGLAQALKAGLEYSISSVETRLKSETYYRVPDRAGDYSYDPATLSYYPDTAGNYLKKVEEAASGVIASELSAKSYISYSPGLSVTGHWHQKVRLDLNGAAGLKTGRKLSGAMMVFEPDALWDRSANLSANLDLAGDLWYYPSGSHFLKVHYRTRRNDDSQYLNRRLTVNFREGRAEIDTQLGSVVRALFYGEQNYNASSSLESGLESESRGTKAGFEASYFHKNRTEPGIKANMLWEKLFRQSYYVNIPRINYRDVVLSPFIRHQLGLKGSILIEISQTYRRSDQSGNVIPMEFSVSRPLGQSQGWKLQCDYKLNNYLTSSVSYDGRKEPQKKAVHNARAEIRANF